MRRFLGLFSAAAFLVAASQAIASPIVLGTYTGSGTDTATNPSTTVSAKVVFSYDSSGGGQLIIDLTNKTDSGQMMSTADLVTGLIFSSDVALSGGSATATTLANVATNKTVTTYANPSTGDAVNNGWGGGGTGTANQYFTAGAGLGLGSSGKAFDGTTDRKGANYGILPDASTVANKDGFPTQGPYVYKTVEVAFSTGGNSVSAADLSGVSFLFGTNGLDLPDANIPGTPSTTPAPLPASAATGLVLLAGLGIVGIGRKLLVTR